MSNNKAQTGDAHLHWISLLLRRTVLIAILWAMAGCAQMGPKTIAGSRFDYNQAIVRSADYQMLLNLVRLRYQDSILFLDLTSVVTSYQREVGAGVAPSGTVNPTEWAWGVTGGATWSEEPTISYTPLQGEDYAKRLLAPIQPSAILLLSRSGWGLERLLLCAVQQLNDLPNGTAIGGSAPIQVKHFEKYLRVATLLRALQENGHIQLGTLADKGDTVVVAAGPIPMDAGAQTQAAEVISLLNVSHTEGPAPPEGPGEVPGFPGSPVQIMVLGRSFLGVMTFLAQHVDAPEEHVRMGLVRVAKSADGKPFDWRQISHGLFHVHSSRQKPKLAYLQVQYRGFWFWIDDSDTESKSTYRLLMQLFSLQAASSSPQVPLITIPAR